MTDTTTLASIRSHAQAARVSAIEAYRAKPQADKLLGALRQCADQALRSLLEHLPLPKGAA